MQDLTGKTLYLAVRCDKNFRHIIPLKPVEFDLEGVSLEVWGDSPPFDVICPDCGNSQQARGGQVIVWLGPLPNKTFQTHPAFQSPDLDPQ